MAQHSTSTPLVSVIIPIYNTSAYLSRCLNSVARQTYQRLEILLIDDGSTDASGTIADRFARQDRRFRVIHQPNRGQSAARNAGLRQATGAFISFIDSDDAVAPDFIAKLLHPYLTDSRLALTLCGIRRRFVPTGQASDLYLSPLPTPKPRESRRTYILKLLVRDGRLYSSFNKLYRAAIAQKLTFDEHLNFAEDTKFVLDYLRSARSTRLAFVSEPLYLYNFGTATSTVRTSSVDWRNWQTSYRHLKAWVGPHPSLTEKFWLQLVLLRWRLSYLRAKIRARRARQPS